MLHYIRPSWHLQARLSSTHGADNRECCRYKRRQLLEHHSKPSNLVSFRHPTMWFWFGLLGSYWKLCSVGWSPVLTAGFSWMPKECVAALLDAREMSLRGSVSRLIIGREDWLQKLRSRMVWPTWLGAGGRWEGMGLNVHKQEKHCIKMEKETKKFQVIICWFIHFNWKQCWWANASPEHRKKIQITVNASGGLVKKMRLLTLLTWADEAAALLLLCLRSLAYASKTLLYNPHTPNGEFKFTKLLVVTYLSKDSGNRENCYVLCR